MFEIVLIIIAIIPEGILEAMLIPLFPYIASSFNSDNGIHTGLLTSAFYMPLFIMNIYWGMTSDTHGRKPILLAGLVIGLISALIISQANSFSTVFVARLLAGFFGSNSTIAKSMIGDYATNSKELAWGYSAYGAVYGFSGIVGPMLAGILYDPATLYPQTFSKDSFFGSKPVRLVCYFGAGLTAASLVLTFKYLKDPKDLKTAKSSIMHEPVPLDDLYDEEVSISDDQVTSLQELKLNKINTSSTRSNVQSTPLLDPFDDEGYPENLKEFKRNNIDQRKYWYLPQFIRSSPLFRQRVVFPIFLYCVIAFVQMVYLTAIPLFLSSEKSGVSMSAQRTSLIMMVIAMVKFPLQVYGFQKLAVYFRNLESCYRVCSIRFSKRFSYLFFINS